MLPSGRCFVFVAVLLSERVELIIEMAVVTELSVSTLEHVFSVPLTGMATVRFVTVGAMSSWVTWGRRRRRRRQSILMAGFTLVTLARLRMVWPALLQVFVCAFGCACMDVDMCALAHTDDYYDGVVKSVIPLL